MKDKEIKKPEKKTIELPKRNSRSGKIKKKPKNN